MIHVVAAAVTDTEGRVLIAQRPPGKPLAGGWEFPGGKLEAGESRTQALARELEEELGIVIRQPRPLMRLRHTYPFGEVLIDMWVVARYSGDPRGLDGQQLRWCTLPELEAAALLPADRPIVRALRLPERLVKATTAFYRLCEVGAMAASSDGALQGVLSKNGVDALPSITAGADFVVLTQPMAHVSLATFCSSVPVPVFTVQMALETAWQAGATGISLIDHGIQQ